MTCYSFFSSRGLGAGLVKFTVLLLLMILMVVTTSDRTLVDGGWYYWSGICSFIAVVCLSLAFSFRCYRFCLKSDDSPINESVTMFFACLVVLSLLIVMPVMRGLPIAVHYLVSEPGYLDVTVNDKPDAYYSKRCLGRVEVDEFDSFLNSRICIRDKLQWSKIEMGKTIRMQGEVSPFGFTYRSWGESARIVERDGSQE